LHKTDTCKLQIAHQGAQIKVEVNRVGRGLLGEASKLQLCAAAQEEFDAFSAISVVSIGQLYGGKLCAALDRQHPRDFFDVRLQLDNPTLGAVKGRPGYSSKVIQKNIQG